MSMSRDFHVHEYDTRALPVHLFPFRAPTLPTGQVIVPISKYFVLFQLQVLRKRIRRGTLHQIGLNKDGMMLSACGSAVWIA